MANQEVSTKERIEKAILHLDTKESRRLVTEIDQLLAQPGLTPQQVSSLQRVQAQLAVISLRFQSNQRIQELLSAHASELAAVYDEDDFIDRFNARLGEEPFFEDRDNLRDQWLMSLQQSEERLGGEDIQLGTDIVPPTVSNWIKLFISDVGNGKISNVKRASFYAKNQSVTKLDEKDRKVLKSLLSLYEFLKIRSDEVESFSGQMIVKDAKGDSYVLTKDDVEPLYDESTIRELKLQAEAGELSAGELIDLRIQLPQHFTKYPVPLKSKATLAPQVKEKMKDSMMMYFDQLETTYPTPQLAKKVSVDQLVKDMNSPGRSANALQAELMSLFSDRGAFASFIRDKRISAYIKDHFPEQMGKKNKELINQSTLNSIAVQALLETVFVNKLQLSEEESLWRSYQVIQQLPMALKDFRTVVSYDVNKGKLIWRY